MIYKIDIVNDYSGKLYKFFFPGITNTIGRILSGVIADVTKVDALIINNVALVISAVLLFLEPLCTTYALLVLFAALYGLCVCKCFRADHDL